MPTVPFTATQIAQIRYYCGYPAYAAYGYVLAPDMALLDTQLANMSDAEQVIVVNDFLAVLPGLKTAIDNAGATLNVGSAGPYTRNPNEMAERTAQYRRLRLELCELCGCAPGDRLRGGVVRC